jgi:hypothetical protein
MADKIIPVEEVESLERRIAAIQKAAQDAPSSALALADVMAELEAVEGAIEAGNQFANGASRLLCRPGCVSNAANTPAVIRATISEVAARLDGLNREAAELRSKIAAGDNSDERIKALRTEIAAREAQIRRLHGGILGLIGLGQPFGSNPYTAVRQDTEFITEQIRAEHGALVSRRERARTAANERWSRAVEDLRRWIETNEVSQAGVREFRISFGKKGSRECAVCYRVILHRIGNRELYKIDHHSKFLFLPFNHVRTAEEIARAGVAIRGALAPQSAHLDEDGKPIPVVEKIDLRDDTE